jgi:iron complex outermembrane receptor protein
LEVRVTDPQGKPVEGARVSAAGSSTSTSPEGTARLCEDLGASPAEVTIDADGFAVARRTATAGAALDVRLSIRPVETPIVVTGLIEPRELAETDRTLRVLNVDNRHAVAWSFADLLKNDSSIDMRERGPDGTQADLSIRGSGFDQVLVMINGVRVSDAQTGHHSLDLPLPFEAVEQVEVLHGAGSTLYGSDAIGGTVNFVTKKPDSKELKLMGGAGEHGWTRMSGYGGFRRGPWTQTLAVARDFSTGFVPGRDFRNVAFSSESFLDTDLGSTSVLVAWNDRPFGANGFYGPYDSWEDTGTKFVTVSQTIGRNADRLQHRFNFAFRRHNDEFVLCKFGCSFGNVPTNFHKLDTLQGNYAATGRLTERSRWAAGAQYLSEEIDSTVAGERDRDRGSAYVMLDLRPVEKMTISVGVREEVWRKWRFQTSPSLALGYWLGAGVKVRGQAGAAFRIPTYTDLYHRDPGNVGNPTLKPEQAWNYEGGLDWYGSAGTKVSAVYFRRLEDNTIDWVKDDGSSVFQARNFQELDFHGGEIEIRQRLSPTQELWGNYTALRASARLPVNAISRYTFNFPQNQAVFGYRGTLGPGLLIKTQIGAYNRTWQSAKALWDVSVGWDRGIWRPFVQATNLLNSYHEAFPGLAQPGRWLRGGLQIQVF